MMTFQDKVKAYFDALENLNNALPERLREYAELVHRDPDYFDMFGIENPAEDIDTSDGWVVLRGQNVYGETYAPIEVLTLSDWDYAVWLASKKIEQEDEQKQTMYFLRDKAEKDLASLNEEIAKYESQ